MGRARPPVRRDRAAACASAAPELAALIGYEAGKNRLECVGEVEEVGRLLRLLLRPDGAARRAT